MALQRHTSCRSEDDSDEYLLELLLGSTGPKPDPNARGPDGHVPGLEITGGNESDGDNIVESTWPSQDTTPTHQHAAGVFSNVTCQHQDQAPDLAMVASHKSGANCNWGPLKLSFGHPHAVGCPLSAHRSVSPSHPASTFGASPGSGGSSNGSMDSSSSPMCRSPASSDCSSVMDTPSGHRSNGLVPWNNKLSSSPVTTPDPEVQFGQFVYSKARELRLDPTTALQLCHRVPHVQPECVLRVLKHCMSHVHVAATALCLGTGAICGLSIYGRRIAATGFTSIFTCIGDESYAALSPAAKQQCDSLHELANVSYDEAQQHKLAANECRRNGVDAASDDAKFNDAFSSACRLREQASSIAYAGFNRAFNTWHIDLTGMCVLDAFSKFVSVLEHLISLDYPGGVLLTVVTGCGGNDTIDDVTQVEGRLPGCIVDKGGVVGGCLEDEGAERRAGRVRNLVVALLHTQQDAAAGEDERIGVAAACQELSRCLTVHQTFKGVAAQLLSSGDAARHAQYMQAAQDAWVEAQQAKAMLEKKQQHLFEFRNRAANKWRIDLHHQGERMALQKFINHMDVLQAMGLPVEFSVITGRGKHSPGKVPKVRVALLDYLEATRAGEKGATGQPWPVTWSFDGHNDGVVVVTIPAVKGNEPDLE